MLSAEPCEFALSLRWPSAIVYCPLRNGAAAQGAMQAALLPRWLSKVQLPGGEDMVPLSGVMATVALAVLAALRSPILNLDALSWTSIHAVKRKSSWLG